jgi:hypothetical protein
VYSKTEKAYVVPHNSPGTEAVKDGEHEQSMTGPEFRPC